MALGTSLLVSWWEQPGWASSCGAAGFCCGPLALSIFGGPITPLPHLGADPCGETETVACPALIFLVQGWDHHLITLIWGRIWAEWEH